MAEKTIIQPLVKTKMSVTNSFWIATLLFLFIKNTFFTMVCAMAKPLAKLRDVRPAITNPIIVHFREISLFKSKTCKENISLSSAIVRDPLRSVIWKTHSSLRSYTIRQVSNSAAIVLSFVIISPGNLAWPLVASTESFHCSPYI